MPVKTNSKPQKQRVEENPLTFRNLKRIVVWGIIGILLIILGNFAIATTYCYQESANTTNQTGIDGNCTLNYTGTYNTIVTLPSNIADGYFYINYTKPNNIVSDIIWQVKHGNTTTIPYNITLPTICTTNNIIQLRIESYDTNPASRTFTEPFCYNTTGWTTIGNNYTDTNGAGEKAGINNINLYDGNWSTESSVGAGSGLPTFLAPPNGYTNGAYNSWIYEEAIYWHIHSNNITVTITSPVNNSNTSYSSTIPINWTITKNIDEQINNITLTLLNSDLSLNSTLYSTTDGTKNNYSWANTQPPGTYYINVSAISNLTTTNSSLSKINIYSILNITAKNITGSNINTFTTTLYDTNLGTTTQYNTTNGYIQVNNTYNHNYTITTISSGYSYYISNKAVTLGYDTYTANLTPQNTICFNFYDMLYGTPLNNVNVTLISTSIYTYIVNNSMCKYNLNSGVYTLIATAPNYTTYTGTATISNTINNQSIYLTNNAASLTVFVKNTYDQYLLGAIINVYKQSDNTLVQSKTTDLTGSALFNLDINQNYLLTVNATGYNYYSQPLTITTSSIVITLGTTQNASTNYYGGIVNTFSPGAGNIILNNTNQQFNTSYTNQYWNITSCTFTLLDQSNNILNTTSYTTCNFASGSATLTINTANNTKIKAMNNLTINNNGTTTSISYQTMYGIKYFYEGDFSISHGIKDFKNFDKSGFGEGERIIIVFVIIISIVLAAARTSVNKYVNSGTLLLLVALLVIAFSITHLMDLTFIDQTTLLRPYVNQWGVATIVTILAIFTLWMNKGDGAEQ